MKNINKILVSAFIVLFCHSLGYAQNNNYDVCVYGETPSGITAAIQAARMGKQVLLLSTGNHVGGVMTAGLTATDINNYRLIGGIAREAFQKLYTYYQNPAVWRNQTRDEFFELSKKRTFTGKNDSLKMQWVYESNVLENIFKLMLKDAKVTVIYNQKIKRNRGVVKEGTAIKRLITTSNKVYSAKVFIDATYEGDLMATSGVSYIVGRESNTQYGETFNGVRLGSVVVSETNPVDPYIKPGDSRSGILPFIEPRVAGADGSADKRTQAYCYRLTLTDDSTNLIPIEKPKNYNPLWFELMARIITANPEVNLSSLITFTPMPNKKTDTNHLDFVGASYDYPEAGYKQRNKLDVMHANYAIGMLWFLGNDTRVPERIRGEMKRWGLPKDEYRDNHNFPNQLYVREARRMVSDFVMREQNCTGAEPAEESVGLGTYMLDCHFVSRMLDSAGRVRLEGTYFRKNQPYTISYRALTPKKTECSNLLVPVCLSSSHVAYGTIRMEPVYMVLGQSAGAAAALSIETKQSVQDVSYPELKEELLKADQIISLTNKKQQ
jgi:hypothetical protein